ncbi:MAG: M20/M25/M40 family metallo-hydrolase, partial [Elusimicrobiaceae bacterium]|nr:M20/M25/M40 family metallo-hydrolase [Elusimicrobiaceae bacterium]
EVLSDNPTKPHGEIQLVIAPNEETGGAANYITEVPYRPEIAFDFDGGVNGELMVDNFNALQILCTVKGHEGHQSNADGPYVNHGLAASELVTRVYENPSIPHRFANNSIVNINAQNGRWLRLPSESRGKEGYLDVFLQRPSNDVTIVDFRARSFAQADLDQIKDFIEGTVHSLSQKYSKVSFSVETKSTYNNVGETAHPASLEVSRKAFEAAGVKMNPTSIRAGTTGAIFAAATKNEKEKIVGSFMLPTGQNNMHSYTEWLSEEDMYESFLVGLNIIDQVVLLKDQK